ncbi:TetR/AcrR family transcriptional regulator [Paeniglutamicibacter psychrophenolicus]|uniref:TetR/AcrR family transcriptional regulator n=1 Tax=Paeniglutamicibacter psychrophenolicus TaxID=257454 RepID=UPI002783DEEA|nr:TetR/AcrR family transcriptional regulator [Paeniglutamicibacter psychrophenolicus]MDQ0096033.1 AcrR family transcriptional regulator [Paeniglutamicibacter psychrophenolicus]
MASRMNRAQSALATRQRMLGAAYDLIVASGYHNTTMAEIAERAGVAVQTLYFSFGSKQSMLQHVYEHAVYGVSGSLPPEQQDWFRDLGRTGTLGAALETMVENTATVLARTAPLDEFVRAAASDPEAAKVRRTNEALRRTAWSGMLRKLEPLGTLAEGLDHERATDIMMVLMSPTTYQSFVAEYGWTPGQWRSWCVATLAHQLFRP